MRIVLCLALAMLLGVSAQAYRLRLANTPESTRTYTGIVSMTAGKNGRDKQTCNLWIRDQIGGVKDDLATVSHSIVMVDQRSKMGDTLIRYTALCSARGEMTSMVITCVDHGHGVIPAVPVTERVVDMLGTTLILPADEVKIGDSWVEKGDTHFVLDTVDAGTYHVTYKLIGTLELGGKSYLKISSAYTFISSKVAESMGRHTAFSLHGSTTFLFDPAASEVAGMDLDFAGKVTAEHDDEAVTLKGILHLTHQPMPSSSSGN